MISHFIKCKNLGDVDALLDLSNYLFTQGEAYKEQSLDYAIEYVRNADADTKKKKAVLEKQMLYYDKQEKHERDKIVCERIEREAADNGLHITRMKCKVKKTLKKVGTKVLTVGTGAGATVLAHIICVKLDNGKEKK